jgi:hypothetical protein
MARERFKEGVSYFDKKDYPKARVAFLQAYALKKHPAVLLNLAQSELRSGHEGDAAKHFAQYLREHKDATEAERQGAETGLTAAKALVSEVTLDVDVSGAEIYLDGDLEGAWPLPGPLFLLPGAHQVQARKDGRTATAEVNATAGQSSSLRLRLEKRPPAPVGPVAAEPAAVSAEPAPLAPSEPSRRMGFVPWVKSTPGALVGVGLTGVGLIGSGAFALGMNSSWNAAERMQAQIIDNAVKTDGKTSSRGVCNEPEKWLATTVWAGASEAARKDRARQYVENCDKYNDNVKAGDTFKTLAIVSLAVAGAAAVGTVVYYFVDSKESAAEAARRAQKPRFVVLPVYQPGYSGGLVSGTF